MSRLMSVALTEPQVRDRSKTVTRRVGWLTLREGDRLTLCRKVMGRRKGEPLERIVDVEVVSVRREPLAAITFAECFREGFPFMTPAEFVTFFCGTHKGCTPASEVTRIEWRYLDAEVWGLNSTARATLRDYGITEAEWARRNGYSDGEWGGDACGCPDDRCIGFHHLGPDDCGCLLVLLEDR